MFFLAYVYTGYHRHGEKIKSVELEIIFRKGGRKEKWPLVGITINQWLYLEE